MKITCDFQRTASSTATLGSLGADATRPRRFATHDIMFGSEATPADAALLWTFQRCTAVGTSTAVTPAYLDPGDSATEFDFGENHSGEPTYTANTIVLNIPCNQRATFRWSATPGFEIITPQTASNGYGIQTDTITTGTPVITATIHGSEM